MELRLSEIQLPLRHPFSTSHGTITEQRNLLVELRQDGISGYGEGAASHAYKALTVESMRTALECARNRIEAEELVDPEHFWQKMEPALSHNRFALCALDQAAHDLWGKLNESPVWKLWGLTIDAPLPLSNYTIGIDSIDTMVTKINEFKDWPSYKIKLGTDRDLEIVRALREHTDAPFRIDANTAWSAEQTLNFAEEFVELNVDFIEQPLPADAWDDMARIKDKSPLPLIADESCQTEQDIERCAQSFHGINIKLSKAGGMTPARRMVAAARSFGLNVMAGCMTESSVGISAVAQLLPMLDDVDMDGATLIKPGCDIASGVRVELGRAHFPKCNGNGVTIASR